MVDKEELSFEKPDEFGVKLCIRHVLAYLSLISLSAFFLSLIISKETIFVFVEKLVNTNLMYIAALGLSLLVFINSLVWTYLVIAKTKKYITPWDTILFTWSGIVILLFVITMLKPLLHS